MRHSPDQLSSRPPQPSSRPAQLSGPSRMPAGVHLPIRNGKAARQAVQLVAELSMGCAHSRPRKQSRSKARQTRKSHQPAIPWNFRRRSIEPDGCREAQSGGSSGHRSWASLHRVSSHQLLQCRVDGAAQQQRLYDFGTAWMTDCSTENCMHAMCTSRERIRNAFDDFGASEQQLNLDALDRLDFGSSPPTGAAAAAAGMRSPTARLPSTCDFDRHARATETGTFIRTSRRNSLGAPVARGITRRLYGRDGRAWCPQFNSRSEWLQIALGTEATVTGVMTQGRGDGKEWVTAFAVNYSSDAISWRTVLDEAGRPKIFEGNVDSYSVKHNLFQRPFSAEFVRLQPLQFHRHPSMREWSCWLPAQVSVQLIGLRKSDAGDCDFIIKAELASPVRCFASLADKIAAFSTCKKSLAQPPFARLTASSSRGRRAMRTCDASYGHLFTSKAWCAKRVKQ
uniref:F5/8 type C domain-containing protein n=1 Tax=Macrostomum lignano TaxID=282301 RepID=A0A1I8F2L2_9PLAT